MAIIDLIKIRTYSAEKHKKSLKQIKKIVLSVSVFVRERACVRERKCVCKREKEKVCV